MKRKFTFGLFFLLLLSCNDLLECIIQIDPEIDQTSIKTAVVDQPYSQIISAHVKNDPADDFYEYFFDVYGSLPDGMNIEYNFRSIEIYGIPQQSGSFRFTVEVRIGAYDDGNDFDPDPTCSGVAERTFTLRVEEE